MKNIIFVLFAFVAACAHVPLLSEQPAPPPDLVQLSHRGEDVPALEPHLALDKVTVVDFYADWCGPCRDVDNYLYAMLAKRSDIAYRKINIGDWDTPVAKRYLTRVPTLPYVIIYGRDGKIIRDISGLDLDGIREAVDEGSAR
jgi:thiol-disulfide isomerase/thioredoxin